MTLRPRGNNVETTLKNKVISTLDTDILSILCKVENPISDYVSFSTSDQRDLNGNLQCRNYVDSALKCWWGSIYEKVSSKDHSACNFTNKLKLVGIFQGLC